jgi:hypothetical protein
MEAFQRRRPGVGFKRQQVGNSLAGRGKLEVGSVNHFRCERTAASNTNRLRPMMSFLAAGAAGCARLRAAQILSVRQLIRRIVNDFVGS